MAEPILETQRQLTKAELVQISWNKQGIAKEVNNGLKFVVQFNPASLRVTYSNQVQSNDQAKNAAAQFVGRGSTKMTLELVLDVSMPIRSSSKPGNGNEGEQRYKDVRAMTEEINKFIQPKLSDKGKKQKKGKKPRYIPPGVRFKWGKFWFDGIVESMDETLELWSEDGIPLRATVSLGLSQQGIFFKPGDRNSNKTTGVGTNPFTSASENESFQEAAEKAGEGDNWQAAAAANGIENPRFPPPGQLLDFSAAVEVGGQLGAAIGEGIGYDPVSGLSAAAESLTGFNPAAASVSDIAGQLSERAAALAREKITFNR